MRCLLLGLATAHATLELTSENWRDATAGKMLFVKFFNPNCYHCLQMKAAWDTLAAEYEGHDELLVADVDCMGEGEPLCTRAGIDSFPTMRTYEPDTFDDGMGKGKDYKGGRKINSLRVNARKMPKRLKAEKAAAAAAEAEALREEL